MTIVSRNVGSANLLVNVFRAKAIWQIGFDFIRGGIGFFFSAGWLGGLGVVISPKLEKQA